MSPDYQKEVTPDYQKDADLMALGLLTQMVRSVGWGMNPEILADGCQFITANGRRCALGMLLPSHWTHHDITGDGDEFPFSFLKETGRYPTCHHDNMYNHFRTIHNDHLPKDWYRLLKEAYSLFDLKWPGLFDELQWFREAEEDDDDEPLMLNINATVAIT